MPPLPLDEPLRRLANDLALLVYILDRLPADLQERVAAADVVRIVQATLREVRR